MNIHKLQIGRPLLVSKENSNQFLFRTKAVKIIDPDTGVAVGPHVVGEITYKSDYPMLGYLNHPEENERFFGNDGFLHSGDLGHYDEAGNLYFDGRLKELIKYKNFHLYPNELEELLMAHDGVQVNNAMHWCDFIELVYQHLRYFAVETW